MIVVSNLSRARVAMFDGRNANLLVERGDYREWRALGKRTIGTVL
jgi:hypothetical protein